MVYRFIKRRSTGSAFLWFLPCCDWWNTTPETQRTSAIKFIFHFLYNWSWQMVKPFDWWRHMIPSLKCCIFDKKQRASNLPFRFLLSTSIYNDVICELHWTELNWTHLYLFFAPQFEFIACYTKAMQFECILSLCYCG